MPDLKTILRRFSVIVCIFVCGAPWCRTEAAEPTPNIVLIFADDLGYGDVGCFYRESPFKTPNLDRMAAEGARLSSFYVPTPYCAPSRATLLTGRYPFRHGLVRNPAPDAGLSNFGLNPSEVTIAELLKARGYATAAFGKWHLGHQQPWLPRAQGFDEYVGILYSNDMFPVQLVRNEEVIEYPVVQASLSRRYTDLTLDFIERNRERPFFVYLPHAMPHKPLAASDDFYTPETPDNLYADTIAELDHEVGRVLQKLRELKIDRKTLVIFLSDNGPWFGGSTGGLRGMKARTWEGGLRVPMIARMPGVIPAGIVNDIPAGSIDVLPTICRLTGSRLPPDRTIDGRDLMPFLKDSQATEAERPIFGMHGENLATIRLGKWKLHVRSPGPKLYSHFTPEQRMNYLDPRGPDGVTIIAPFEQAKITQHPGLRTEGRPEPMQLFDLTTDRGESRNVAKQNPGVVKRLKAIFDRTAKQFPKFEKTPSEYFFRPPAKGQPKTLMRLIGGELRYDRVPKSQEHLLAK